MSKIFKGQTQIGGANVVKLINAWALLEYCMGERARVASQTSTCILGLQERCSRAFPPKKNTVLQLRNIEPRLTQESKLILQFAWKKAFPE